MKRLAWKNEEKMVTIDDWVGVELGANDDVWLKRKKEWREENEKEEKPKNAKKKARKNISKKDFVQKYLDTVWFEGKKGKDKDIDRKERKREHRESGFHLFCVD